MFDRVLKMLLTGKVFLHLVRYYLFKISIKSSGRCLEYEQVNVSWLVIIGTWYRASCRPHHSWNRKKNLVSTLPRSPKNAIPEARKVFYNKLVYHICTFPQSLCQPPKFCIISTQISTINKKQQHQQKRKQQNSGKNQKNHMSAYS